MMGGELSPAGRQQRDEYHRKLLFQGDAAIWGVQTRVMAKAGIVAPGRSSGLLDFASMSALIDFRRLRQDVTWQMATRYWNNDDGSKMETVQRESIDPRFDSADTAPLMGEFCSQPIPELRQFTTTTGAASSWSKGRSATPAQLPACLAQSNAASLTSERPRTNGASTARSATRRQNCLWSICSSTNRSHSRFRPRQCFTAKCEKPFVIPATRRERNRLPLHETLQDLGSGALVLATPEVPRHRQMVQAMFDRAGWNPSAFHGFRMKIAFPACPTALVLRYRLPNEPGWPRHDVTRQNCGLSRAEFYPRVARWTRRSTASRVGRAG